MAFFPAFGAAFGGGPFGAMGAPAPIVAMELIPSDEQDRVLYELDKACGVGKAMRNPELAKHLSVAQETAEKPLTKIRELLKPYRKSEDTLLDSVSTYRFRSIVYEQRDGDPRVHDVRLMTEDEWKELYGDSPQDVKRFEETTTPRIPLYPVPKQGFEGLSERLQIQERALHGVTDPTTGAQTKQGFLEVADATTTKLESLEQRADRTRERIAKLREKSQTQLQRLLRVAQKTELVAFGPTNGMGGYASRGRDENQEEADLRARLAELLQDLSTQHQLGPRIDQLRLRVESSSRAQAAMVGGGAFAPAAPPQAPVTQLVLDAGTRDALERVDNGIRRLKSTTETARAHIGIAEAELHAVLGGGRAGYA